MSVWYYPHLVKRKNDKLTHYLPPLDIPKRQQISRLVDVIGKQDLRKSLLSIINSENPDLSLIDKANTMDYGDNRYEHLSFTAIEVRKFTNLIRNAFEERGDEFTIKEEYIGVLDRDENHLNSVYVEVQSNDKTQFLIGRISVYLKEVTLNVYHPNPKRYEKIDLTIEKPRLHEILYKKKGVKEIGEVLDWRVVKKKYYDILKPELDYLEMLSDYAEPKGFEIQIIAG